MKAPDHLPTLAGRTFTAKDLAKPSKVDRIVATGKARKLDEKELDTWRKAVRKRDRLTDRYTGKKVVVTLEPIPEQAQCHHVEPRENRDTRYDVRNGLLVSLLTHARFEVGNLSIVDGQTFVVNGRAYWDCSQKVKVLDKSTGISRWI